MTAPFETAAPDDFDVDVEVGEPVAPDPFGPPASAGAPGWTPSGTWPANAPGLEVAEEALLAAMDRTPPPYPELGGVALQVADALSTLEEAALARRPLPVDGGPIRRAAAMRVRVGFAFATAPAAGSNADAGTVGALLAEIDALLSEVSALAAAAPAEHAAALGACRNALVKEAIDFSEASQRYVQVEVQAAAPASAPAARRPPAAVRVLSVERTARTETDRRRLWLIAALVAAVAVAGGFHALRAYERAHLVTPARAAGLPGGLEAIQSAGTRTTTIAPTGEPVDPGELERFKAAEQAKGNEVVELPGGVLLVRPAEAPPPEPGNGRAR